MEFSVPSPHAGAYRLWRLRRLIAFSAGVPIVIFGLVGAIGFGAAASVVGFVSISLLVLLIVAGHSVFFPNAHQETLSISFALAVCALISPILGGSIFGWFLFILFALWVLIFGQTRVLFWETASAPHQPRFESKTRVRSSLDKARTWFPLRPNGARGQYRCGDLTADGTFPVWYETPNFDIFQNLGIESDQPETSDSESPPTFYARIDADEANLQRTHILSGPDLSSDLQAVVEHRFVERKSTCIVTEIEVASSYPRGQSFSLWLNDFAQDGLDYHRDLLEGVESLALRVAHRSSLLVVLCGWMMKRMTGGRGFADCMSEAEVSEEKLGMLLQRLGPDYIAQGHTSGPMPLVTLEEFFDGNGDDGSFQGATVASAKDVLETLRMRQDVADVRLGVTQWNGPATWPLAEYIYIVTTESAGDIKRWFKDAGLWISEISDANEHRPREELSVPEGHRIVWAWMD